MLWVRKMRGTAATESALINLGNVGISDAIVCLIDGTGIQGCHAVLLRNLFGQVCLSQLDGAPTDDAHVQLGQKYNLGRISCHKRMANDLANPNHRICATK